MKKIKQKCDAIVTPKKVINSHSQNDNDTDKYHLEQKKNLSVSNSS